MALLVLAVGWPSLPSAFQFDDYNVIVGDPRVQSLAGWWQSMPGMRALTKLTWAVQRQWGHAELELRLANLLLHATATVLLYAVLLRFARRARLLEPQGARFVATVATLLFALHPVQTESVTYLAARPQLLMGCLSLGALLCLLPPEGTQQPGNARCWLAAGLLALAFAGKETALVLPLVMALCLALHYDASLRSVGRCLWPVCATAAALVVVALWALPYPRLVAFSLQLRDPLDNLLAQTVAWPWLLQQLWDWPALNADPALLPPTAVTMQAVGMWLALAALLAVAALAWRRRPALSFGLWWILLWLAPTNSVLARLDLANDRQWYLAIAGVGWLLGLGLWQWRERWPAPARWIVPLLVTALALGMALGTASRNRVYIDETAFWTDVTRKSAHNGRAWNNLGMALALDCRPLAAADAFERAASLGGEDWRPRMNLALLAEGGLPDQPADPACRLKPDPSAPR